MTFEGTVIALTKVCPREEAGRPVSDIIIVLLVRFDPVVGRGLGSVEVHLVRDRRLAQAAVILAGSGVGAEVRVVEVGQWDFVVWVGRGVDCERGSCWVVKERPSSCHGLKYTATPWSPRECLRQTRSVIAMCWAILAP